MENALLSLLGVLIYGSGAAVLGVSLIQLVDKGYTHPLILLGLVFNVIAGFITAVVGFIYAWEHMHRM